MPLIDSYDRVIDYLRVSVTDRCNFRCVYCMPEEGSPVAPKESILSFEEIVRLVRVAVELGMTKIRLTGGEPLVRRDIDTLVQQIGQIRGLRDFSMTTNGFLLERYAPDFARSGLNRVNISLDTLRPDRFARIARRGDLDTVLAGIEAAWASGLVPVKLNCVVMSGWNDDEVADFARLTLARPYHIRFIELMPINWSQGDDGFGGQPLMPMFKPHNQNISGTAANLTLYAHPDQITFRTAFHSTEVAQPTGQLNAAQMRRAFVSTETMRARIEAELGPLTPVDIVTNGPARTFRLPDSVGTIGFISQITNDLCAGCNRLRLTADGQLRPCLMADGEVDLREALRSGASDSDIADLIRMTVRHKPKEHRLEDGLAPIGRNMSQIGG